MAVVCIFLSLIDKMIAPLSTNYKYEGILMNHCLPPLSVFFRERSATPDKGSLQLPYFYASERYFIAMVLQ
jgi:hypothetical protein